MNKGELVNAIAGKHADGDSKVKLTKAQIEEVLSLEEEVVAETLGRNEKVQRVGYLTLEPVPRAERKGYDPLEGKEIDIEAKMGVKISAGSKLKNAVQVIDVQEELKKLAKIKKEKETNKGTLRGSNKQPSKKSK